MTAVENEDPKSIESIVEFFSKFTTVMNPVRAMTLKDKKIRYKPGPHPASKKTSEIINFTDAEIDED